MPTYLLTQKLFNFTSIALHIVFKGKTNINQKKNFYLVKYSIISFLLRSPSPRSLICVLLFSPNRKHINISFDYSFILTPLLPKAITHKYKLLKLFVLRANLPRKKK